MKIQLKLRALALTACAVVATQGFAHDFEVNGIYYNKITENTVEVTFKDNISSYKSYGSKQTIDIPATVDYSGKTYIVTEIGNGAFLNCNALTSVVLPKRITWISTYAFSGCTSLQAISCKAEIPPACGNKAFQEVNKNCKVYVQEQSLDTYKKATTWSDFNYSHGITLCNTPTITEFTYNPDRAIYPVSFVFFCTTSGSNIYYTVSSPDMATDKSAGSRYHKLYLQGDYYITVWATKDGMMDSDAVRLQLIWVGEPDALDLNSGESITDVSSAKAQRGVAVYASGGNINVGGTISGETINVYSTAGSLVKSVRAEGDNTVIGGLKTNDMYIVKIGGKSVKVAM